MKTSRTGLRFLGWCFLLAASGLCARAAQAEPSSPTRQPNFIVVFCDNLGYGDIGPFGSRQHRTPHLDRMAAEGTRFTDFYVTSGVCTSSRASLMTGCYPRRVNLHENEKGGAVLQPVSKKGLHPDEITIAEILKTRGYATACIGKWHLGDQPPFLPTRQGFDEFFGIPYSDDMTGPPEHPNWPPLPLMRNQRVVEAPVDRNLLTKRYTEEAIRFITANQDRPFFLYLPHATPGSTRTPFVGEAFRNKSKNGPWGDAVEELDWSTGEILAALKRLGLDQTTLVIWTSDNGAPQRKPPQGSNRPLSGWGYTTAEGGMRVPCIMRWPGKVPAGATCRELCSTIDLLPTLARLAGSHVPGDRIIDGRDIRPLLFGAPDARSPHEAFYYYSLQQLQAVRSGKWKLFLPLEAKWVNLRRGGGRRSPAMLYNLETDLAETSNVADKHPDVVQRLLQLAEKARADLGDVDRPGKNQRAAGWIDDPQPQLLAPRTAESVVPIDWKPLECPAKIDDDYRRAADILSHTVFYNLRWAPAAAVALAWTCTPAAEMPTYQPVPAEKIKPRAGIGHVMAKIRAGQEVTVAYLGGSITAANGWRPKTTAWLKETFPNATFKEIHAAIGGTGSDLGVFRVGHDVLQYGPDLLFVEFAVNDGGAAPESIWRSMEGIVRQTWRKDPRTDIVFTYTIHQNMIDDVKRGFCPRSASAMELLADFYGIPSVNFAVPVVELLQQGELVFRADQRPDGGQLWFSTDGCHPRDEGHEIYLKLLAEAITQMKDSRPADHQAKLAKTFVADNWEAAKMVPLTRSMLSGDWQTLPASDGKQKSFGNRMGQIWTASRPGSKLHFKFKGAAAKLYDLLGPDGGQVVITVDGKTHAKPVPRFDSYCTYHRIATLTVASDADPNQVHDVTVEIHPEQPDRSSVAFRLKDPAKELKAPKFQGTNVWVSQVMLLGDLVE